MMKVHLDSIGDNKMDKYDIRKEFSAYSALFNLTPNSTFIRDGLSNKVIVLYNDESDLNLKINNEKRLKSNVYRYVRDMYNDRIKSHNLKSVRELPYQYYDEMINIRRLQLKFDKDMSSSGKYNIYPRTFYCKKCGNYIYVKNDGEFENFNPKKCRK